MAVSSVDVHQELATSNTPAARFQELSRGRQREVFFQLRETIQRAPITDMAVGQLQQFVRRLDPDEPTIFITTATDGLESFIFLGLATVVLGI